MVGRAFVYPFLQPTIFIRGESASRYLSHRLKLLSNAKTQEKATHEHQTRRHNLAIQ